MGDLDVALAGQEESLLISRRLRKAGSSRSEQITDAETLAAVADLQFELGKNEAALKAYPELLPLERDLVASDPSDPRWQGNLSCTLTRVGDFQLGLGNPKGALSAYEETLAIRQSLADLADDHASFQEEVCFLLKRSAI